MHWLHNIIAIPLLFLSLQTKRGSEQQKQDDGTSHNEESTSALEQKHEAIKASRQQGSHRKSSEVLWSKRVIWVMVVNAKTSHANEDPLLTPRTKKRREAYALKQRTNPTNNTDKSSKGSPSPNHPCDDISTPNPLVFHI